MMLLLSMSANAATVGYSSATVNRTGTFRLGSSSTQGQAIRLSKAKLQAMKGKKIDYVEFAVGSANTTGKKLNVFISTSLGGTPVAEGTIDVKRAYNKCKWTLDTPYEITGNEDCLYIGYTAEISSSYRLLLADGTCDLSGCNYALKDGEWTDIYGMNVGSAYITANVEGLGDYTDAIVGRNNFDGYFKAGNNYDFEARFLNAGTTVINSFDAVISVAGNKTVKHFDNLNVAPKDFYSFSLDGINSNNAGEQDIAVEIANVNGGNNDIDTGDNAISANMFFYPHDMERSLFLEGFTGQDCSNCPTGHMTINSAVKTFEDAYPDENIVEVSHHAGFYPDIFTTQDDAAGLFYYGPGQNYAPAVMVNRYADENLSSVPVVNASSSNVVALLYDSSLKKPYVSLNLQTELDKETRELKVTLGVKPQTQLPSENVLFNVYLVQDSIQAYQNAGGSAYTHNRVVRGNLTGNVWGMMLENMKPGEEKTWTTTFTIPEKIHSDYWTDDMITEEGGKKMYDGKYDIDQVDIEAVLENMSVVAYVGEYDTSDYTKNYVYNCCEAKLGESHKQGGYDSAVSGIENVGKAADARVYVAGGRIYADGNCDSMGVYTISGERVNPDATLEKGVYIVKTVVGGKQSTKKILVK